MNISHYALSIIDTNEYFEAVIFFVTKYTSTNYVYALYRDYCVILLVIFLA